MCKERSILMGATCPVCNKEFMPAPFHAYTEDGKTFCKWTCLCKYRRNKETKKEENRKNLKHRRRYTRELRTEAMRMIIEEHKTQKEVADKFGLKYSTVNHWTQEHREGWRKL